MKWWLNTTVSWWVCWSKHRCIMNEFFMCFSIKSERRCGIGVWDKTWGRWTLSWKASGWTLGWQAFGCSWRCDGACVLVAPDVGDISFDVTSALVCNLTSFTIAFSKLAHVSDVHNFVHIMILAFAASLRRSFLAFWRRLLLSTFAKPVLVFLVFSNRDLSQSRFLTPLSAQHPVVFVKIGALRFVAFLFGNNAMVFAETAGLSNFNRHFFLWKYDLDKISIN